MSEPTRRLSNVRIAAVSILAALLTAASGAVLAAPAMAAVTPQAASWCSDPTLTQPFAAWGDQNYYTLVRGQDDSGVNGDHWQLSGGASIVTTQLPDGTTGGVVDLPSGSEATSPAECVNATYPDARLMVDDITGDEGIEVYASYRDAESWGSPWGDPVDVGAINGGQGTWALSDPIDLPPPDTSDWELVKFTFVAGGASSEFQICDFYLDPYNKG
jgi:hypothetical protein